MFTLAAILKLLAWLLIGGLAIGIIVFWQDILNFVRDMLEDGREAVIQSEWNAKTKRLVVTVIDKVLGLIKKKEDTFVDEDEIWKMVPEIYTEEEARRLINQIRVNKNARR